MDKQDLMMRFSPFFRKVAEQGLSGGACALALDLVGQCVPYELGTLWLRHGEICLPAASVGPPLDLLEGLPLSGGAGLVAWIARTGVPVRIPSASRGFRHETLRAFLGVPLRAGRESQGVIALGHTNRIFEPHEHDRLCAVAALVAPAVRHGLITARLRATALVDPATGLFSQRYFLQCLEREVGRAQEEGGHLGVLLLHLGPPRGASAEAALLLQTAAQVRSSIPSYGVVARWSGRALAALLPGADQEEVAEIGARLARVIQAEAPGDLAPVISGASFPSDGTTAPALLAACQEASEKSVHRGAPTISEGEALAWGR